jgi:TetR/AcrR family transcriptional regulator
MSETQTAGSRVVGGRGHRSEEWCVQRGRHAGAWGNVVLTQDEQFALKRRALLRQAARAFSAKGYSDTSLIDVAKSLGVTKSALYYYVSNKQEILFECHMLSHDFGDQAIEYSEQHGRNGREKIMLLVQKYMELLTSEIGSCAVLLEFNALSPENRKVIGRRRDAFERHFRRLVKTGIADGSLRNVDPKLAVFFFMGAVNWLTRWYDPAGEYSGEHIAKEYAELLDAAIAAR